MATNPFEALAAFVTEVEAVAPEALAPKTDGEKPVIRAKLDGKTPVWTFGSGDKRRTIPETIRFRPDGQPLLFWEHRNNWKERIWTAPESESAGLYKLRCVVPAAVLTEGVGPAEIELSAPGTTSFLQFAKTMAAGGGSADADVVEANLKFISMGGSSGYASPTFKATVPQPGERPAPVQQELLTEDLPF